MSALRTRLFFRLWCVALVLLLVATGCGGSQHDAVATASVVAADSAAGSYAYVYDAMGLATRIGGGAASFDVTRTGDTLVAGASTYHVDPLGRIDAANDLALAYGPDGQVATAARAGHVLAYVTDEEGHRLMKSRDGVPVAAFVREGYVTESDLDEPVRVGGKLVGILQNGVFQPVATDMRGTVQSDRDGTPHLASPFGARPVHPDVAEAFDFATSGYDADLGIDRMGVRDYDPTLGRFFQPDPLFFESPERCVQSPAECSLYGYARANPLSYVDPSGTQAEGPEAKSEGGEGPSLLGRLVDGIRGPVGMLSRSWETQLLHIEKQETVFHLLSLRLFKSAANGNGAAYAEGAKIYSGWAKSAKAWKVLGRSLEVVSAVLSGVDAYRDSMSTHPKDTARATRHGVVAFGVDIGFGVGAVALGSVLLGPVAGVIILGLYMADGTSGAVTGHSATHWASEHIAEAWDRHSAEPAHVRNVPGIMSLDRR